MGANRRGNILGDIRNPRWLYFKAFLLLLIGFLASAILLLDAPRWRTAALLGLAVWGFCRAYYFAFYVIEHYIDPNYRFAGIIDFARYALSRDRTKRQEKAGHDSQTQIR